MGLEKGDKFIYTPFGNIDLTKTENSFATTTIDGKTYRLTKNGELVNEKLEVLDPRTL